MYKNPTITTMPSTRQAVHATAAPRPNGNYRYMQSPSLLPNQRLYALIPVM